MNNFTYKETVILESQFDFSRLDKGLQFSGEVVLSTTIATPQNPDKQKAVACTLDLSMGADEDKIQLRVKSRSIFVLEGEVNIDTLQEDAKVKCYPKASEVLSERIAELTRLHIGKPLNISIPREF